ncbi:hypothetical protein AABB24_025854 [Solanum stoloniferum]|uniref:Uncharacterized protein n=1 Tax=Solanum stoloniferum TaxID=62892 RepID=A0ABD2SBL7_9SOLN
MICNTSSILLFGSRFPILKPTTFFFFFGVCVSAYSYCGQIIFLLKNSCILFSWTNAGWCWTMKSDVYIFGHLLVELITKTKLRSNPSIFDICKPGSFVHKCFEDVDDQSVFDITLLACRCVSADPGERPTMKMVLNDLDKLRKSGKTKKR